MSEYSQGFPDYESATQEHPTETESDVRRVRNKKRGRLTKAQKAAQMRRWRAKHAGRLRVAAQKRMRELRALRKSSPPDVY